MNEAKEEIKVVKAEANVKVNDLFEEPHVVVAQQASESDIRAQRKVKIIIHNQEGILGSMPVFVAVNGFGFHIPREVESAVPESIVKALENATETRYYREIIDDVPKGPMLSRDVRRFPFSIMG
jgi:acetyl-CoA carboxylase beta subunit